MCVQVGTSLVHSRFPKFSILCQADRTVFLFGNVDPFVNKKLAVFEAHKRKTVIVGLVSHQKFYFNWLL